MAWQVAIVVDAVTDLRALQVLLGQMPVWALATPERKANIRQLSEDADAIFAPDPAFTVFTGFCSDDPIAEILNLIPTIEEHHYRLSTLRLFGIDSSEPLAKGMAELGYELLSGTMYPGLGYAKPLNRIVDVTEILLDGQDWQSSDDIYQALFSAIGAPAWHGRNLNALNDSIATGSINKVEVPYRITVRNADAMSHKAADFFRKFEDLVESLQINGCPVEIVLEESPGASALHSSCDG
jgi:RNAse (barnase) inhibitor barstar